MWMTILAAAGSEAGSAATSHQDAVSLFVVQIAVIVLAAKAGGRIASAYLKQPAVLGEIVAGIIIGPYALGGLSLPLFGPLFPMTSHGSVPPGVEYFAYVAAVVLLFLAGLETDVDKFFRFLGAGLVTGLAGAMASFSLGAGVMAWLRPVSSFENPDMFLPAVLIMGTVAMATSVGITARVLGEKQQLDSPEGAAILSAAVLDDIMGLVVLAVVLNMVRHGPGESIALNAAMVAGKAILFWVVTLAIGILCSRQIAKILRFFGRPEAMATAALGLALLLAGLAEKSGLALIIGSYTMGLSLSKLDMAHEIEQRIAGVHDLLVPIFFCAIGMRVNFTEIHDALPLGMAFAAACIVGKVVGSGAGARLLGFNNRGALRVGFGMTPRQEVALIVAGVGLTMGIIDENTLGAVVLMALATTVITPPVLSRLFDGTSGVTREREETSKPRQALDLPMPGQEIASLLMQRLITAFQSEQFFVHILPSEEISYEMRKEDISVFLFQEGRNLRLTTQPENMQYIRFVILEELLALGEAFREASEFAEMDTLTRTLLTGEEMPMPLQIPEETGEASPEAPAQADHPEDGAADNDDDHDRDGAGGDTVSGAGGQDGPDGDDGRNERRSGDASDRTNDHGSGDGSSGPVSEDAPEP